MAAVWGFRTVSRPGSTYSYSGYRSLFNALIAYMIRPSPILLLNMGSSPFNIHPRILAVPHELRYQLLLMRNNSYL